MEFNAYPLSKDFQRQMSVDVKSLFVYVHPLYVDVGLLEVPVIRILV